MRTMENTAGGGQAPVAPVVPPDELQPGAKAGPWIVERELGRGGMGAVYAVVHEEIGKRAALKVVHARLLQPGFNCDRMLLEAKAVNQVGHPNIVDIFETGKLPDGRPYIVMERLEGQPLSYRADEGKILPDQVISLLLQMCDALIAAHAAGVIHRDLKLDNVFLTDNVEDPNTPKIKLLDWGIAKIINHNVRHTIEGQLVGTPQYLSPEQARGHDVTPQTDVYSLGVMAYELFLEQLPFEAETSAEIMAMHLRVTPPPPRDLWPDIPAALESLLMAMLAKSPDDRPTMLEVARRLEIVRNDLQRRRSANLSVAVDTVMPMLPARATRLGSSSGLAATEMAMEQAPRRWQFALGAFALVASTMLFLISRAGDSRAASAATTPTGASYVRTDTTLQQELAQQPSLAAPADAPAAQVEVPAEVADVAIEEFPLVVEETPAPVKQVTKVAKKPAPRMATSRSTSMAHRSSTRKDPVAPRRATKIDPDGTIDPYR
ncbi:MAG: serine/threonine protein kinase [Deltaproteobacteria bacterium]|nr:serine/threonine protein kinase [Deltaproteobacteria bacterium]MDQ3298578.1 serine/threonine protein kinase [Myxococcota bacterium]